MSDSRTKNTTRNIVAGLAYRLSAIILPFINRTAVLWILGPEFTGLSGLFSSILQVLNIAELGFNSAIVYSLYEPMAKNDKKKIIELVSLIKRIYNVVGTVILIGGLIITPFITKVINGSYPDSINIYILFLMYLINSVLSYYLFAYKECLLIADQRQDIANNIRTIVNVVKNVIQFIVLLLTRNFYVYLCVAIVSTVITNIAIQYVSKMRYKFYYDIKEKLVLPKSIKTQVKGLLIDRLSDTCRNSFDSLIITSLLGLTATAIYTNYYYIYSSVYAIMLVICNSLSASVGNSIVVETEEKNYDNLQLFTFLFSGIAGVCTACLACLYQPFMKLWAGENLMLNNRDMILFVIYFYIINMTNIRNQYISGTGIWWKLKMPCIVEAVANLFFNIILGRLFGISGVIIATILTIFFFNFLWRTCILFKNYFVSYKYTSYLIKYLYYIVVTAIATGFSFGICESIKIDGLFGFLLKAVVCLILSSIIICLLFSRCKEFYQAKIFLNRFIKRH